MISLNSKGNVLVFDEKSYTDSSKRLNLRSRDGNLVTTLNKLDEVYIIWHYEDDSELFKLVCLVSSIRNINWGMKVYLYLPYVPYARMDRVESEEDVFTLKYFANIINSLRFDKVIVLDPHSRVSLALFDRCIEDLPELELLVSKAITFIQRNSDQPITIMFPDRGAYERYTSTLKNVFKQYGISSFIYGEKRRNWETSKIESFEIKSSGEVNLQNVLLIDDIYSSGSTMKKCIDVIKPLVSCDIYIYCTHTEIASYRERKLDVVLPDITTYFTSPNPLHTLNLDQPLYPSDSVILL